MATNVKVSILIPTHTFPNSEFFLNRLLDSIREQSFQDYEIIIKDKGEGMSDKLNKALKEAKGELIKIMFTDDYFHDKHALKRIVDAHKGYWSVTGCVHTDSHVFGDEGKLFNPHFPTWNREIPIGNNTIGSPSVLLIENTEDKPYFDRSLKWLVDCDYYQKLYCLYGKPNIINSIDIVIGLHGYQETNTLEDELKEKEVANAKAKFKRCDSDCCDGEKS